MADEDATVEVEDEGYGDIDDAQPPVVNENPNFMMSLYTNVCSFSASYGWPALFMIVVAILLWSNFEKQVRKWLEKKTDERNGVNTDPELLARRAEAMERARQNMQEKASAIIKKEAERRRELEEKKRQERISDYDAFKQGQSSHATQRKLGRLNESATAESSSGPKKKPPVNPLRSDYNPLTGTSSSARYRPAPRRTGGG